MKFEKHNIKRAHATDDRAHAVLCLEKISMWQEWYRDGDVGWDAFRG